MALTGANSPAWKGGRARHSEGYIMLYAPHHHRANQSGYAAEHVLVAETATGFPLRREHEVHHVNGDRADNRPRNLVVCENRAYHRLLHQRTIALRACGHAAWRKCTYCQQWGVPESMYIPQRGVARHIACAVAYNRQWRARTRS